MITHVVLLQPKTETSNEDISAAFNRIQASQGTIPGIIDIQTGKNGSGNHQNYTYGFIIRFVDQDHLIAYALHPAHRVVSNELVRLCHNIIDFDLEQ